MTELNIVVRLVAEQGLNFIIGLGCEDIQKIFKFSVGIATAASATTAASAPTRWRHE